MKTTKGKPFEPMISAPAEIVLSPNSRQVLEKRYLRRGLDGKPAETIEGMFRRVARAVAEPDATYGYDVNSTEEAFYGLLTSLRFFPNSPTFTGAGTPLGQLAACFVLPISDDLGKNQDGIFQTLRDAALIQQTGGGNGFSFSRLRPKGDKVASSAGVATGPVGFLRVYDTAFGEVAQGGSRRGANMGVLRVDHPDIEEFISCKAQEGQITNFNISVGITDAFMRAVEADADFPLVNPRDGTVWRTVKACQLFDKMVTFAHHNGEPGALFLDAANRANPLPHLYTLEATNPCFAGNTRVATDHGFLTMAELYALQKPLRVTTDERAAPEWAPGQIIRTATPVTLTRRNAPVMTLRTQYGYTVTATPDHRFLTPDRGYVPLCDLRPGDLLLIQSNEGAWSQDYQLPNLDYIHEKLAVLGHGGDHASGRTKTRHDFRELYAATPTLWSYDLGLVMGWLVGDGWLSPSNNSPLGFTFGVEEGGYCGLDVVHPILQRWFGPGDVHERDNVRQLTYGRLPYEFFASLGVLASPATEKRVPSSIWRAPREAVRGFLAGLFSADGSVQINEAKRDCTVRLASSSYGLLQDVQLLLANFGIVSRIYQRRPWTRRLMPDGKGGNKDYASAPQYELVIGKANRVRFAELIGFAHALKQARLLQNIAGLERNAYRERYVDRVLTIEAAGREDVFDLTEPATSSFVANGFVVHNCGEQWLGPYENCCLGSINLAQHVTDDNRVDWDKLRETTIVATRFLDNVVDANKYVPAVPQLREAALRARRIGLGIMGLGDIMYRLGVRYGSPEGQEFAAQIMEFIRYHSMATSIELARERGPFPVIQGSIYDPANLKWSPPRPLTPYTRDWGRPPLDWDAIVAGIRQYGIRNAAQTTVAPTGTIGTVTGCEGYGCEPVFALAYTRTVKDGDRDLKLTYTSPLFEKALKEAGLDEATRQRISEQVSVTGSCQDVLEVPEAIRRVFVVAQDITAEEHVRMQAAIQAFVDNSISKCVVGHTLILTDEGLSPIEMLSDLRLPDQFAPLERGVVTPEGVEPATLFYYGGYRETRKVTLESGFELEGTPNHRIHVLTEEGEVAFRRLDELRPGDTVVLYGGQQRFGRPASPLPAFSGRFRTSSNRLKFPEHMSVDLAFLLGCITSEGAITVNGVNISSTDVALLEQLRAIAQALFGLDCYIASDSRNQVHYLQFNSRALRDWLITDLELQAGAENKVIPPCILHASQEEIAAFLRGLFLDGFMTQNGRLFGITLASRRLISQLQALLLNAGILGTVRQVGERAYSLTVQGGELEQLAEWIGFVEVWKNERIERRNLGRLHRYRNYSRLLPPAVTQALAEMKAQVPVSLRAAYDVADRAGFQAYQRARVNLLGGHRMERQDARHLYETLHRAGARHDFADRFFGHDDDRKIYISVEKVESGFAEVFDISVPGSHTFIANGFANHNTINFPSTATVEDVAAAYKLAWKLGCKGLTVYVAGSRQEVVLETKAISAQKGKEGAAAESKAPAAPQPPPAPAEPPYHAQRRPRPAVLPGMTYRKETPLGTAFITVNVNGQAQPFEVFLNVGKAGSDVASVSEALGRLISLVLRLPSPLDPVERLKLIIDQLAGIGGGRTLGFGAHRVRSLPDAIAQVLREHLNGHFEFVGLVPEATEPAAEQLALPIADRPIGDLCPDCGQATFIATEGCRKCYACGYSEC